MRVKPALRSERVCILGLGNPLRGDDGVGPRVIKELESRDLPEGVEALDGGTGGLGLLDVLERGWERVVVVDAADVGQEPGRFVRFTPGEARIEDVGGGPAAPSFHHVGLGEVLALAGALGRSLPEMVVYGVQPAAMDWDSKLSPAVAKAFPALVDAVLDEVTVIKGKQLPQNQEDDSPSAV